MESVDDIRNGIFLSANLHIVLGKQVAFLVKRVLLVSY